MKGLRAKELGREMRVKQGNERNVAGPTRLHQRQQAALLVWQPLRRVYGRLGLADSGVRGRWLDGSELRLKATGGW